MAIQTNTSFTSTSSSSIPPSTGWSKEKVTEESVNQLLVQKFTEIVDSYDKKKPANRLQDLATGPWYANDYAYALQKNGQGKRLEFLKGKNAFFHGFPPKGFVQLPSRETITGSDFCSYQIKADCLPSQGLQNVKTEQFSFFDCGSTIGIAMYDTLKEVLGENRFNTIFSAQGQNPLKLDPHLVKTPLFSLGFVKEAMLNANPFSPNLGDDVYFSNIPLYHPKHPNGEYTGFHTLCISASDANNKKYIAFGTPANGKSEEEINDLLIEEFNTKAIDPHFIFSKQMATHFESESKKTQAEFVQMSGGRRIEDLTITRHDFNKVVNESNHEQAGLHPVVRRLNIAEIHKHMQGNPTPQSHK
ncbi:MAG: hypothetical protein KF898_05980 [Parachlamydiales bacterium]|nr:hypothetical protein [Candidatus Acheromyda pituitae]